MAHRYQRGCLRKESRKNGMLWMLRYYAIRPADGKKVQRTLFVGYVVDFQKSHNAFIGWVGPRLSEPQRRRTAKAVAIDESSRVRTRCGSESRGPPQDKGAGDKLAREQTGRGVYAASSNERFEPIECA